MLSRNRCRAIVSLFDKLACASLQGGAHLDTSFRTRKGPLVPDIAMAHGVLVALASAWTFGIRAAASVLRRPWILLRQPTVHCERSAARDEPSAVAP